MHSAHFNAMSLIDQGIAHHKRGDLRSAEAIYRRALRHDPNHVKILRLLAMVCYELGKIDETIRFIRLALVQKPDFADPYSDLGAALLAAGHAQEASESCREAIRLKPDLVEAYVNLGNALDAQGLWHECLGAYDQALQLNPVHVSALYNRGRLLARAENLDDAVIAFEKAIQLNPTHAQARASLGNVYKDQGRLDEALASYRAALQIKPTAANIHSNLLLTLNYHPGYDAGAIEEECARWNQQHAEPLKKLIQPHSNTADAERRLRIGYVSPDFRDHVDAHFLNPLLSNHDHEHYQIFCYANVQRPDAMTERLRCYADVWRSTVGLSDQRVAEMVRGDQIDILVDLELHAANNRLLMFARKPAPVQVAWLGYPGTTGLWTIDYRLTDPYLDPPGLIDGFYSEESIRLPDTFWCYDPLTAEPPVSPLPALQTGTVTFGCLNNFCKVNEQCVTLWAEVLRKVPQSSLLLRAPRGHARDWVVARLQREGIAEKRIEFIHRVSRQEYLGLYHRIDLGLDTLPCNGHTTSLDASWMGVPTLTLLGQRVVGRAGFSQLSNLGLCELVAETAEQYVELVASLAKDLGRLQTLRGTLRERMGHSPLMDGLRFTRSVETAYRDMWQRWCNDRS